MYQKYSFLVGTKFSEDSVNEEESEESRNTRASHLGILLYVECSKEHSYLIWK